MIFTLKQLEEKAPKRPNGYKEEVLGLSKKISDNLYELSEENYKLIADKYRLPTRLELTKNLSNSALDLIKNGFEARSKESIEENTKICFACEFLVENEFRCGVCGCSLKAKMLMKSWKCPKKKW